ncbi:MAG: hypothetical protein DRP84_05205 [Spirochaetes bacterium]|nr:MAG: hypothetical protein DRP84_05205 [Spirochaetota bacterium]
MSFMKNGNYGRPLYIIDGYNVVFSGKFERKGEDIESLRQELINYLSGYRSKRNVDIVVVWDGDSSVINLNSSSRSLGGVKNLFSKGPENADSKIVKMVAKYEKRGRIIVVSNDRRHIVTVVKNLGAKTMDVESFLTLIGYKKSHVQRDIKNRDKSYENNTEKLNANDLTVEEWLRIFKSKNKKGE